MESLTLKWSLQLITRSKNRNTVQISFQTLHLGQPASLITLCNRPPSFQEGKDTLLRSTLSQRDPDLLIHIEAASLAASTNATERPEEDHDNMPSTGSTSHGSVSSESDSTTNSSHDSLSTEGTEQECKTASSNDDTESDGSESSTESQPPSPLPSTPGTKTAGSPKSTSPEPSEPNLVGNSVTAKHHYRQQLCHPLTLSKP